MRFDLWQSPDAKTPGPDAYAPPEITEYGPVEQLTDDPSTGIPGDCDPSDPSSCF